MFVDARLINDKIFLHERDKNGVRHLTTHAPPYVFYYEDGYGDWTALDGTRVKRKVLHDRRQHIRAVEKAREQGKRVYESDVPPLFRFLEERYPKDENPSLNITFIDIEADKDPLRGWSKPRDPFTPITAITLYHKWKKQFITIATPPDTMTYQEARDLLDRDAGDGFGALTEDDGYILVETEAEMLLLFLELIEDTDIFTSWNGSFYDMPYIIARIRMVLGGEPIENIQREDGEENPFSPTEDSIPYLLKLCLFPELPKMRPVEKYGNIEFVFDIPGRPHCDYLEHYQKNSLKKLHSYKLDYVLQEEVKQEKVKYDGSLDQLQRKDFRRFIAYNRQDVAGLSVLDDKKKMIELANTVAHMASVTFDKILGSVTKIEQAILRVLHRKKIVAFDKEEKEVDGAVPGAFVVEPEGGLYWWVVSFDINSLYPSVIRALNISPETLIGQFDLARTERKFAQMLIKHKGKGDGAVAAAWGEFTGVLEYHDIIEENPINLTLRFEDGTETSLPAAEWKKIIQENNWCVTANGTVFDLSKEGIVSECLTVWYEGRANTRAESRKYAKMAKAAEESGDTAKAEEYATLEAYYDMVQNAMKLMLNSTYGAYLNRFFRFYDARCGRSVTLSGRVITKHMCKYASYTMTGNYDFDKRAIIYGDTDSAYTSIDYFMEANEIEKTIDNAVMVGDALGKEINESFPQFMHENFYIPVKRGEIIQAKRENVARRGLFKNAKKRYALHVVDAEGKRTDEIKTTGMDTKRTDTPKYIQKFLEHCIEKLVKDGCTEDELQDYIRAFREEFEQRPSYTRGTPCGVSGLTTKTQAYEDYLEELREGFIGMKKPSRHYAVTAAMNTNKLMDIYGENRWDYIQDGDKIEILYLKKNEFDMQCVALKVGEDYMPHWFEQLPFDDERHEEKLIQRKLENTFGILGWDFTKRNGFLDDLFG